jgi:hypothetical protein
VEFLGASNLEILNRDNEPTFFNGHRSEVIDITLKDEKRNPEAEGTASEPPPQ